MKIVARGILAVIVLAFPGASLLGAEKRPAVEIRKVVPEDAEILEEWERVTTEQDVLGVSAARVKHPKWSWRISISAAEFVRQEPLESRLNNVVASALKGTKGVKAVAQEDREIWLVQGEAGGEELVRACSVALDQLAEDLRKYLTGLKKGMR